MHMLNNTRISLGAVGGPPGARRSRRISRVQRDSLGGIVNNLLFRCHTRLHMSGVPFLDPSTPPQGRTSSTSIPSGRPLHATAAEKDLFALQVAGALGWADTALEVAIDNGLFQAEARAQLYRGHCFRATGRWRRALECYVRAASVKGLWWGRVDIEGLTQLCRARLAGEKRASEIMRRRRREEVEGRDYSSERTLVPSTHGGDELVVVTDVDGRVVGAPRPRPPLRRVQSTPDLRGPVEDDAVSVKSKHSFAVRVYQGTHIKGPLPLDELDRAPEGIFF
ncbi:hypothetical protein B0T11DRAFT_346261 [Plectosphaerella cucumerina]|uniref:Uncharacterized protein n=1 Tax=Plectosphaerella cucumerina TaxID=40658 RepID=A0A8K0TPU8_9PEZI|nr:hypothetical protein B0T11DRAFT_346261 [Plectosphaerella cucumerina]